MQTRHHSTDTAELPNTLFVHGRGPKGTKRNATNHAAMVTPHTIPACILDVMATFPHPKSMRVNITSKMDTGTSMGLNFFFPIPRALFLP